MYIDPQGNSIFCFCTHFFLYLALLHVLCAGYKRGYIRQIYHITCLLPIHSTVFAAAANRILLSSPHLVQGWIGKCYNIQYHDSPFMPQGTRPTLPIPPLFKPPKFILCLYKKNKNNSNHIYKLHHICILYIVYVRSMNLQGD